MKGPTGRQIDQSRRVEQRRGPRSAQDCRDPNANVSGPHRSVDMVRVKIRSRSCGPSGPSEPGNFPRGSDRPFVPGFARSVSALFVSSGVSCLWRRISVALPLDPKIPFLADVADMRLFCRTGARPRHLATAHMNALVSGRRSGRKLQYSRTTNVAHGLRGCRPPGSGLRRAPAVARTQARGVHNGYQLECRARSPPAVHP